MMNNHQEQEWNKKVDRLEELAGVSVFSLDLIRQSDDKLQTINQCLALEGIPKELWQEYTDKLITI